MSIPRGLLVKFIILGPGSTDFKECDIKKDPIATIAMLLRTMAAAKLFPNLHNCRHPIRFIIRFASQQASRDARARVGTSYEVFYSPVSNARQVLAYVGAATQLVFWGNLAQWAGTAYAVKDT